MRFTRLRLNGFKSFVDPTDLVIADGLTGVVGPNGCGKSNLLEALRWVMGENRPSAMRGGGMEDVIFAGAATRPARNFAEVTLSIDNSDRLAPAGFNDADTIEIVRRITRDAGSAYKVGARDVRARDVQMLFADASTGSHSPALVRQGQISELINAKPKARRRILEEAAGISGLYQRRHEAELKLRGAETNLTRAIDVIEQLAAQLSGLARQARQARRYRAIAEDLRRAEGLLLWLRWREAETARVEADAALARHTAAAAEAERAARAAAKLREEREAAMPALREEEAIAGALVQKAGVEIAQLDAERSRAEASIATLEARVEQWQRDAAREATLEGDAGETLAALAREAAALEAEGEGHDEKLAAAEATAQAAAEDLARVEAAHAEQTEEVARLAARHQSVERLIEDTGRVLDRSQAAADAARAEAQEAAGALDRLAAAHAEAETRLSAAQAAAEGAEAELGQADAAREDIQAREAEARARLAEAEGEVAALKAETQALVRLVERDTAEDGQLGDLLSVTPGFEKALGAALADDLRAPVRGGDAGSGWRELPGYAAPQALPAGIAALSNHVSAPPVLARRLAQIGVVDGREGLARQAELLPGQRLVTREGDLFRWDGLCAAAGDATSAAALRLQQLNRLESLGRDLETASAEAEGARRAHERLTDALRAAGARVAAAREARRAADHALAEASRALSRAAADRDISEGRREAAGLAERRHADEAAAARARLAEAEAARAALGDLDAARDRAEASRVATEAARMTMMTRRAEAGELARAGTARAARLKEIAAETAKWRGRLENAESRRAELARRSEETRGELDAARAAPERIARDRAALDEALAAARDRRARAADALAAGETAEREAKAAERDAERAASEARERRAAAAARAEAAAEAVAQAAERIREETDATPGDLLAALDADPETAPGADALEIEVQRLRRSRDALGAVNLRAEEDAAEVAAEHDALVAERADLEAAIAKLRAGIAGLNREGRERLLAAFEQVNANFAMLFRHLFGGGEARLVLVESEDPLEAGLEIMCQPPGKKLAAMSLLSGGEQTLTALALIFAVFLANPAPICVLDEVDAPLDDANVTRFCDMLDEMCRRTETRFLIITHHAVTMSRMDRLFGVTMGEQGVSQLVSVDLRRAEALVA